MSKIVFIGKDEVVSPILPSITENTVSTLKENNIRALNTKFFLSEEEVISILAFAARVCYKSDYKDTDNVRLLKLLLTNKHMSIFEHVNYTFIIQGYQAWNDFTSSIHKMGRVDRFSVFKNTENHNTGNVYFVTANLRSIFELLLYEDYKNRSFIYYTLKKSLGVHWPVIFNLFEEQLKRIKIETENEIPPHWTDIYQKYSINEIFENIQEDTEFINYIKSNTRYVFHIVCSRVISQQIMRHRTLSFSQESTRWITYNKKANKEDTVCCMFVDESMKDNDIYLSSIKESASLAMDSYKNMVDSDIKAENARDALPLGIKTEFVLSGMYNPFVPKFLYDGFANFFELRSKSSAQKDIQHINNKLQKIILDNHQDNSLVKNGYC